MTIEKLIIMGSGPAGLTAAIYTARAGLSPLVFEGPQPGGQLMGTSYIENWPGEKSILGPSLMAKMRDHAAHFGTRFEFAQITQVDCNQRPFLLKTNEKEYSAHSLIIATGATPKRLGCPGEDDYWGKGVTTCAVCDGAFYKNKQVIIVGGGDTAMEDASFMTNYTDKITVVHVLDKLTASKSMQDRVLQHKDIKIRYNTTLAAIEGDGHHVTGVLLADQKSGKQEKMATDAVFVAIGLLPNTALFKNQLELGPHGYIIQKDHSTRTSIHGIFAAGDVSDFVYRQAITSAGDGCRAALDAERYLKTLS